MIYVALIAAVVVLLVLFGIVMLAPSVTPATATAQDWPEPIPVRATVDTSDRSEIQLIPARMVTREQAFGSALILQRYLVESGYLTEAETLAELSPAILRGKQSEEQEK